MIRKRNPILHWLLAILTAGIYGFIWSLILLREVSHLPGAPGVAVRRWLVSLFSLYLLNFFGFGLIVGLSLSADGPSPVPVWIFWIFFANALGLTALWIALIVKLGRVLREYNSVLGGFALFLLTLCYLISLPYLQSKLNQVIVDEPSKA